MTDSSERSLHEQFQNCLRLYQNGQLEESVELSFQVLEVAQDAGDKMTEWQVRGILTDCLQTMGKYSGALEQARLQLVVVCVDFD